jgi:hypothetical protein
MQKIIFLALTLCLFQEKEEGKKVKGWKDDGKKVFPLFGTTKNDEGKKPAAGAHTKNLSSQMWTESLEGPSFLI